MGPLKYHCADLNVNSELCKTLRRALWLSLLFHHFGGAAFEEAQADPQFSSAVPTGEMATLKWKKGLPSALINPYPPFSVDTSVNSQRRERKWHLKSSHAEPRTAHFGREQEVASNRKHLAWSRHTVWLDHFISWLLRGAVPDTPPRTRRPLWLAVFALGALGLKPGPPLPPAPPTLSPLLYGSPARMHSSDTSCIIYVEKTLPGQTGIWSSWKINPSNLASSLKQHISHQSTRG